MRRKWLAIGLVVALSAVIAVWWLRSPSLTAAEQELVGKWTLPMGLNPPPNAVQQVFWLQAGRKLLVGHRPVGATDTTYSMVGTWRLDDQHLVMEARSREPLGMALARLIGNAPRQGQMYDRNRFLGRDAGALRVEAADGSDCTYLPFAE